VRMADLPTHNRSLPANLATLGHQGTFIYDAWAPPPRGGTVRCASASSVDSRPRIILTGNPKYIGQLGDYQAR
jgi:hypothetical protein